MFLCYSYLLIIIEILKNSIFLIDVGPMTKQLKKLVQTIKYCYIAGVIVTGLGGTCNTPWVNHADSCYLFVTHLKENWSEAVVRIS